MSKPMVQHFVTSFHFVKPDLLNLHFDIEAGRVKAQYTVQFEGKIEECTGD